MDTTAKVAPDAGSVPGFPQDGFMDMSMDEAAGHSPEFMELAAKLVGRHARHDDAVARDASGQIPALSRGETAGATVGRCAMKATTMLLAAAFCWRFSTSQHWLSRFPPTSLQMPAMQMEKSKDASSAALPEFDAQSETNAGPVYRLDALEAEALQRNPGPHAGRRQRAVVGGPQAAGRLVAESDGWILRR